MCPGPQTWGCPQPPSPAGRAAGPGVGGEGKEKLNPSLRRIKPCPGLLQLCRAREEKPPPAAATWGRGEGFVEDGVC